jgi:hypothetical protein
MLYVRYAHLTKAENIHKRHAHLLVGEDYDRTGSAAKKKNTLVVTLKRLGAKTN